MAFTSYDTPGEFFGADYSLASGEIKFGTSDKTGVTVGTTFQGESDDNVLTFAGAHGLLVGDRVRVTEVTTLPTGLTAATDYYVLTVPGTTTLTLSATRGGSVVSLGTDGTADNTMQRMGLLSVLTDALANATTGDSRSVILALMEMIHDRYSQIATADRPTKLTISRTTRQNAGTNEFVRSYIITTNMVSSGFSMANE